MNELQNWWLYHITEQQQSWLPIITPFTPGLWVNWRLLAFMPMLPPFIGLPCNTPFTPSFKPTPPTFTPTFPFKGLGACIPWPTLPFRGFPWPRLGGPPCPKLGGPPWPRLGFPWPRFGFRGFPLMPPLPFRGLLPGWGFPLSGLSPPFICPFIGLPLMPWLPLRGLFPPILPIFPLRGLFPRFILPL